MALVCGRRKRRSKYEAQGVVTQFVELSDQEPKDVRGSVLTTFALGPTHWGELGVEEGAAVELSPGDHSVNPAYELHGREVEGSSSHR